MWDFVTRLFDSSDLALPHPPDQWSIWLTGAGDLLLALACLAALTVLLRDGRHGPRSVSPWRWPAAALALASVSLLTDLWALSNPVYRLCALLKLAAGLTASVTVVALVRAARAPSAPPPGPELLREVRRRKQLERALRIRERQLRAARRARTEFFAGISHDLRTPLTLVLAPLESLLAGEQGPLEGGQRHTLETIHDNAVRLLQMITALLDFSRLQGKKVVVERRATDVAALTKALLADFRPLLTQKGLQACLTVESEPAWVSLDRYLYERIVFNLLSNAVKFTPAGGRVTLRLALADEHLRLSVQDTGVGLARADTDRLFRRAGPPGPLPRVGIPGSGLGLALIKEFSELLGGTVAVDSEPGRGSTFTVECFAPTCPPREGDRAEDGLTGRTGLLQKYGHRAVPFAGSQPGQELPRVVIADGNEELVSYIAALLHPICTARRARDGEAALALVRSWAPDLVLAAVMMDKRDGLSLCKEIKAHPETAAIPVVLLTAQTHREALLKGWEAGADEYLFKPFHPKELVTRVRSLLAGTRERKRAEEKVRQAERLAAIGEMVTGLAHESRNALQRAEACLELLALRVKDRPELLPLVHDIQKAQDHLHYLYEEVRGYAAPINLKRQRTDLGVLLGETWEDLASRNGRQAQLEQQSAGVDLACEADPMALGQVFRNVLENALSAGADPVEIRAAWSATELEGQPALRMCLVDNGPGMSAEVRAKVFEPFFTTKTQGTGLGMAIARRIVEAHGGRIGLGPPRERGAEIVLTLPRTST
jgi:signal transduction histidine kinase